MGSESFDNLKGLEAKQTTVDVKFCEVVFRNVWKKLSSVAFPVLIDDNCCLVLCLIHHFEKVLSLIRFLNWDHSGLTAYSILWVNRNIESLVPSVLRNRLVECVGPNESRENANVE